MDSTSTLSTTLPKSIHRICRLPNATTAANTAIGRQNATKTNNDVGNVQNSHPTKECKSDSKLKCGKCKGEHEVWHHKCPVRIAESRRQHALRGKTSPYF